MYFDLGHFEENYSHVIGWTKNKSNKDSQCWSFGNRSPKHIFLVLDHSEAQIVPLLALFWPFLMEGEINVDQLL